MSSNDESPNIYRSLISEDTKVANQRKLAAEAILAGDFVPTISDRVRTIAYFALGIGAPTVGLVTGLTSIWVPELADNVASSGIVVLSFLGTVGGVFGILNRPTKYPVVKVN